VYESDRAAFAGLDPDGDGIACPNLGHGFAPAFWATALPNDVVLGTLSNIVDGDTYEIVVDGQSSRYRLYHADTPETQQTTECGGSNATDYVRYVLSFSDAPGQVWVESVGQRDRYGRTFAYIWIKIAGEPYLLNHVLINNGWAQNVDQGDAYDPYLGQLLTAASFANNHKLGVWNQCGGFGIALATQTPVPTEPPPPTQAPAMNLGGSCDPNYTPCVPNVPGDLNCPNIGYPVQVIGYDRYGLDRDHDGRGCE
jgi:endonuclease YncB( thermonuclease family)